MPFWFAAIAVFFVFLQRYWIWQSLLLYGCVGYLLGSFFKLRQSHLKLKAEHEVLADRVYRLTQTPQPTPAPKESEKPRETISSPSPFEPEKKAPLRPDVGMPPPAPSAPKPPVPRPTLSENVKRPEPVSRPEIPQAWERETSFKLPSWFTNFFTKGNIFAKVGAVLLFFGVSFLIKLVAEMGYFPLEFRLLATGVLAFALIALGWRLRAKNEGFALILQGTGFGVFYLTVFGAFRIWSLLPATLAFGLVVGATVLFCLLSVIQNSKTLAMLAILGGFSAPVLISTGSGNHVALFSYYALLNLGILGIAKYRPWRELNLLGFLFTFIVGAAWGEKFYVPEHFMTVEPFLIFHFLLYVVVALFFSKLQLKFNKDFFVDAILVLGVPMATCALQWCLVRNYEYGMALSAAAFGAFYIALATILFKRSRPEAKLMIEAFLASGICFTILAVPFALNNAWTSAVWALQGAFLVWVNVRQNRPVGRYFGMALQALAAIAFFERAFPYEPLTPVTNAWFLGSLIVFGSAFFIAFQLFRRKDRVTKVEFHLASVFVLAAVFWWTFGLLNEIPRVVSLWYSTENNPYQAHTIWNLRLMLTGLSFFVFFALARRLAWPMLGLVGYGLFFVLFMSFPTLFTLLEGRFSDVPPFLNSSYLSSVLLALAAFLISRSLYKGRETLGAWEKNSHWLFLVAGYFWWVTGHRPELCNLARVYFADLEKYSPSLIAQSQYLFILFLALSCLAFRFLASVLNWLPLERLRLSLTILGTIFFLKTAIDINGASMLSWVGVVAWPLLFVTHYGLLRSGELSKGDRFCAFQHFSGFWLFTAFCLREVFYFSESTIDPFSIWRWVAVLGTTGMLAWVVLLTPEKIWPFGTQKKSYIQVGLIPHFMVLLAGMLFLNLTNPGNSDPLPYLPVLNPLEVITLFCLMVIGFAYLKLEALNVFKRSDRPTFAVCLGLLMFVWLTMGMVRTVHHYGHVPWTVDEIIGSRVVQTTLSIFWGVLSLSVMVFAHRKGWRVLWIAGTVLMVVVVGKLFLFDLRERGTLERVISFIGSGVLMLLTGYFAPIPPAHKKSKGENE